MKSLLTGLASLFLMLNCIAQDVKFPRQLTNEGAVLTLYQPQVQSWENQKKLDFRMAFTFKPMQGKEVVGVIYMKAATDVNMENHRVLINNMSFSHANFPSLDEENSKKMEKAVSAFVTPDRSIIMSLEQVVACTPKEAPVNTIVVNNDPPVIFFSKRPTILLSIEGAPVKAATGKDSLEFVINANYPLFYDKVAKTWFLYDGLEWQKANESGGPWAFTSKLPASFTKLAKDTNWTSIKGLVPAVTKADKKMPQVFYTEKLAELILFEGEPAYKTISGTTLKFATNTTSDIIFCSADKQYYYVTSGRWFRSANLNGPWTYATNDLPADFLKIPANSPAAAILPFVPGTEEAKDAVMIAQIPTKIEMNATEAAKQVNITYSGEPQFKPIDSTTLSYAVNTTEKVIKVSNNQYYACVQGIWFVSTTPNGPWQTATSVPQSIYSMPASSPVYNVTYVTQNVTNNNVVQSSYTSGYTGVYVVAVAAAVIIVSGTGYYHPPYYHYPPYGYPIYYPHPVTYGMYAYHPYPYGGVAYHASYNPYTGAYARSATAYTPYGKTTVAQGYNPSTGTYARGASVSTPYGTKTAAQAYNPYTGTGAATRQNSNQNAQWGSTTVSKNGQTASAAHITTKQGSAAAVKTGSGDMYATANGNVYKNTGSGWEDASSPQANPKSGNTATQNTAATKSNTQSKPTSSNTAATTQNNAAAKSGSQGAANKQGNMQQPSKAGVNTQDLNKEYQNRQRGNTQTQQYSGSRSYGGSQRTGSAGNRSGGGRRGR